MDRWRAAGALLALAACIASSVAAPTATSNHTALDLYDEHAEGCYYNFQHYGEGDRIMTNEPCLNCTCHNRMLMCYLRVCPFTKAIGQDCTVEKRADQCCPIVTCPDVPVDLLTSTSTSSPAEYGGTGVGKVDNYGCTINGRYFSEGSKVPQTPGKPCEHCYCIRNMTTCVMQECTLHVDGCTPIYHKDVCCPVRYFCDHPEDEMPLLDDMTTTVRPTPGFLLTTTPGTDVPTTTLPPRRDCVEDDQLYPDGALIKTEKPCEHCYCMKGDIVCVVQECGTPMENEGKNCTSLPPRVGQCCPDTYICEGDELSNEPTTETTFEELTTMTPPRRVSVEGSGYRNEDETSYTEAPTFITEIEGSGEEELEQKPLDTSDKVNVEQSIDDKFVTTENDEFIPKSTHAPILEGADKDTTESNRGPHTVPSGFVDEKTIDASVQEKTTPIDEIKATEPSLSHRKEEQSTTVGIIEEKDSSKPPVSEESKVPEPSVINEQSSTTDDITEEEVTVRPITQVTIFADSEKATEPTVTKQQDTEVTTKSEIGLSTESSVLEEQLPTEGTNISEHDTVSIVDGSTEPSITATTLDEEIKTTVKVTLEEDTRRKPSTAYDDKIEQTTVAEQTSSPSINAEETPESHVSQKTTTEYKLDVTEPVPINEQNTVPVDTEDEQSSESSTFAKTTKRDESTVTEIPSLMDRTTLPSAVSEEESNESLDFDKTSTIVETKVTEIPVFAEKEPHKDESTTNIQSEEQTATTEPAFRKEDETSGLVKITTPKETEVNEVVADVNKESASSSPSYGVSSPETQPAELEPEITTTSVPKYTKIEYTKLPTTQEELDQFKFTTIPLPEQQETEKETITHIKETTTESMLELSTFAHIGDKKTDSDSGSEKVSSTSAPEKELGETTTSNPEDNEIAEVPSPGRIPGEGDCLLEGVTYNNDSIVPSNNKCHTSCKCISSIIKCDPILCSPPPEYMDNCQLRYDTPESCCPTYVCDNVKETIPPQPHSQMSGTESPTSSPSIECNGDQCEVFDEEKTSDLPPKTPEKDGISDCGSEKCSQQPTSQHGTPDLVDSTGCEDDKCALPDGSADSDCTSGKCEPSLPPAHKAPEVIPSIDVSLSCANPEDCKETKVPCEGDNCKIETHIIPPKERPQLCENQEDCKEIPDSILPPCEGESCTSITEDCNAGDCKIVPSEPSHQVEICSGESGCDKPEVTVTECKNGACEEKDVEDRIKPECNNNECLQQLPVVPSEESIHLESLSTDSPVSEQATIHQEINKEDSEIPELTPTLSEATESSIPKHTIRDDQKIKEHEPSISDEEQKTTQAPADFITTQSEVFETQKPLDEDKKQKEPGVPIETQTSLSPSVTDVPQESSTETVKESIPEEHITETSQVTESALQEDIQSIPTGQQTEQPLDVTESHSIQTESSIEGDKEKDTATELPQSEIGTKGPESAIKPELNVTPGYSTELEEETTKPETEFEKSPEIPETPDTASKTSPVTIGIQEAETMKPVIYVTTSETIPEKGTKVEIPAGDEVQTELPMVHVTEAQETYTNVPKDFTTGKIDSRIPEDTVPGENIVTTSEIPISKTTVLSDEFSTKATDILTKEEEQTLKPLISVAEFTSQAETVTSSASDVSLASSLAIDDEKQTTVTESYEPVQTEIHQEVTTESSTISVTEKSVTDHVEPPVTTEETIIESDMKLDQEHMLLDKQKPFEPKQPEIEKPEISTKSSVEPEILSTKQTETEESGSVTVTPQILLEEKTTSMPLVPSVSVVEVEKDTKPFKPSVTEEYEMSTEEIVQTEEDSKQPEKEEETKPEDESRLEEVPSHPDDTISQQPETDKPKLPESELKQPDEEEFMQPHEVQTVEPEYVLTKDHDMETKAPEAETTEETQTDKLIIPEVSEHEIMTEVSVTPVIVSVDKVVEGPVTPKSTSEDKVTEVPEIISDDKATETIKVITEEKVTETPELTKEKTTESSEITLEEETTKASVITAEDKATETPGTPEMVTESKATEATLAPDLTSKDKATEAPEITSEDQATEAPVAPSLEEKSTEAPEVTSEEKVTDAPVITSEDNATITPEVIIEDMATESPEKEEKATETPGVTYEEITTKAPDTSLEDKMTETPDIFTEEKVTRTSEITSDRTTESSEINLEGKVTQVPEVSSEDRLTETPDIVTKSPEVPEIYSVDKATETPEIILEEVTTKASQTPSEEEVTEASSAPEISFEEKTTTAPKIPSDEKLTEAPEITFDDTSEDKLTKVPQTTLEDMATDIPTFTSEEKVTNAPEIISADIVTEYPVVSEVTFEEKVTAAPEITSNEKATKAPGITSYDNLTDGPEILLEDKVTKVPETTLEDVTYASEAPEIYLGEKETGAPEITLEEKVTGGPQITSENKVTEIPEIISEEKATEVPVITSDDRTTKAPEIPEISSEENVTDLAAKEPTKTVSDDQMVQDVTTDKEQSTQVPEISVPKLEESSEAEFVAKDVTTKLPDISRTSVTESPTTEKYTTKAPENEYTEKLDVDVEETSTTKIPEISSDKQSTGIPQEPPITQKTESITTVQNEEQEREQTELPVLHITESKQTQEPESVTEQNLHSVDQITTEFVAIEYTGSTKLPTESSTLLVPVSELIEDKEKEPTSTYASRPDVEQSETTPYLVELEEHTHKIDAEVSTMVPSEEPTTARFEAYEPESQSHVTTGTVSVDNNQTELPAIDTEPWDHKQQTPEIFDGPHTTESIEVPEKSTKPAALVEETLSESTSSAPSDSALIDKYGPGSEQDKEPSAPGHTLDEEHTPTSVDTEKPYDEPVPEKGVTEKPQQVPAETTAPEEEFIPVTTKATTAKAEEEPTTPPVQLDKFTKPDEKPSEVSPTRPAPEVSKPDELHPTDEVPSPEDDSHFPPSGGYNQEPDYVEEDQAFGPGTCRYGGKVYVSAQQIPRDDPCDFCFCFRSDIICLQQSCPPPIHGCHEEPIQGFCCPRYECPVSMATTLNVTTTTTTTTTTLPPHFLPHAYKGAAQRRGCQIKGHTYKVGEVVRASSGPCLHCTCGGDGQMKCDPKACTPEPMLRQMIAAAVSAKRRR